MASSSGNAADQSWGLWFALPIFPYGTRKTVRTEVVKGQIWTFDQLQGALYVHVPVRMTVVKLRDRSTAETSLFAFSPVAPTRECLRLVRELEAEHGPVRHIVLPTLGIEHKVFAGPFARAIGRGAQLWVLPDQYSFPLDLPLGWLGFAGLGWKRLPATSEGLPWEGQLEHTILGTFRSRDGAFAEAVFVHKPSASLLVVDSIVSVRSTPPEIMESDVDAMLFHARDNGFESVRDTPAVRRRGWQRIALFALYFNPGGKTRPRAFRRLPRTSPSRPEAGPAPPRGNAARARCGSRAFPLQHAARAVRTRALPVRRAGALLTRLALVRARSPLYRHSAPPCSLRAAQASP
jgi:hypothetical protein